MNDRGAASVLVIFMLLILVTLGALAITSANANYRLSQRSQAWNAAYYELDAQGEQFLSDLDAKLAEAERLTIELISATTDENQMNNLEYIANNVYMTCAFESINEMMQAYPAMQSDMAEVEWHATIENDTAYSLAISVSIVPLTFNVTKAGESVTVVRADNQLRYKINQWYEYQENTIEEPEPQLWDGNL